MKQRYPSVCRVCTDGRVMAVEIGGAFSPWFRREALRMGAWSAGSGMRQLRMLDFPHNRVRLVRLAERCFRMRPEFQHAPDARS